MMGKVRMEIVIAVEIEDDGSDDDVSLIDYVELVAYEFVRDDVMYEVRFAV